MSVRFSIQMVVQIKVDLISELLTSNFNLHKHLTESKLLRNSPEFSYFLVTVSASRSVGYITKIRVFFFFSHLQLNPFLEP